MRKHIAIDFETYYDSQYSITTLGNYHYTRDPRFNPYCISVADGTESWAGKPADFNWDSLTGQHLFAHNRGFDHSVLTAMQEKGLAPQVDYYAFDCTSDLSAYLLNKRSLAQAVEHFYGHHMSKVVRSDMKGKRLEDLSPEESAALYQYADDDAIWCQKLAADHFDKWPESERRLSRLNGEQCAYGVAINQEALASGILAMEQAKIDIHDRLPWIGRGAKPTSPIAIAEECKKAGIPPPPVKTHDPDDFFQWETQYGPLYPWIGAISECRSVNKFLKSLYTIRDRIREDGTMPFGMKYFGAHTGRWSGAEGYNMQNMTTEPVYGVDFRGLMIPRPAKKFILVDLSQIEARVVQWLAGNEPLLKLVADGYSLYEAYARATGRWTGEATLKSSDPRLYKRVKAAVLGLGFGCGAERYVSLARQYGVDLALEESQEEVTEFRQSNPLLAGDQGLWRQLDNDLKRSAGSDYTVELPSGRCMNYRDVRFESRAFKEPDGKVKRKSVVTADIGRRASLYGGLLCENITQATARDIFAENLLGLVDAGHRVLWTIHDEAVCEVDQHVTPEEIEKIMAVTPEWVPGLPVGAEAHETTRYCK